MRHYISKNIVSWWKITHFFFVSGYYPNKRRLDMNLVTFRHSPLKPRTIWRVEATIRAPWVPRIIFSNFCTRNSIQGININKCITERLSTMLTCLVRWTAQYKNVLRNKCPIVSSTGTKILYNDSFVTSRGSTMLLYRPAKTMEIVVGTKVKDPPITAGNLVPNNVWANVFSPATKRIVWMILAFSSYSTNELSGIQLNKRTIKKFCNISLY